MKKLEKSIRHELNCYGAGIRAYNYGVPGFSTGIMPKHGFLDAVYADAENGIVTDIRLYTVGDAKERRDYCGESIDITAAILDYIKNRITWDEMISDIEDIVKDEIDRMD